MTRSSGDRSDPAVQIYTPALPTHQIYEDGRVRPNNFETLATPTHEAGHVAAAWLLFGDDAIAGDVTLVETTWALASAAAGISPPPPDDILDAWYANIEGRPMAPHVRDYIEGEVMIFQAGAIAVGVAVSRQAIDRPVGPRPLRPDREARRKEAIAAGETPTPDDTESIARILDAVIAVPEEAVAYAEWLRCRTFALCDSSTFQAIVAAIVPELVEHRTLGREAVLAIIHRVIAPASGVDIAPRLTRPSAIAADTGESA